MDLRCRRCSGEWQAGVCCIHINSILSSPASLNFSIITIITTIIIIIIIAIVTVICLCLVLSGSRQLASVVIEALLALGDIILQGEVQQSLLQGDSNNAFKLPFLGHIFEEGLTSSHLEEGSTVVIHHPGLGAATVVGARQGAFMKTGFTALVFSVYECGIIFFRCCVRGHDEPSNV